MSLGKLAKPNAKAFDDFSVLRILYLQLRPSAAVQVLEILIRPIEGGSCKLRIEGDQVFEVNDYRPSSGKCNMPEPLPVLVLTLSYKGS